jgi:Tol biopolymer transport system component
MMGDRREAKPVIQTRSNEIHGRFSPDGHWIAYRSDDTGQDQLYVQAFPVTGGKRQISTTGGGQPHWRGDGKELFWIDSGGTVPYLMAVDFNASKDGTLNIGAPHKLFSVNVENVSTLGQRSSWDVTPDGQHFLFNVLTQPGTGATYVPPPITVVINWMNQISATKMQ